MPETISAKAIREERATVAAEIRKMADLANDKAHKWTGEDETRWQEINANYNDLTARMDKADRAEKIEAEQRETKPAPGRGDYDGRTAAGREPTEDRDTVMTDEHVGRVFRAWSLSKFAPSEVSDEDVALCRRFGIHPNDKVFRVRLGGNDQIAERQACYRSMHPSRAAVESSKIRPSASELRALSTQVGASGGFAIAPNFNAGIESAMLYYGPMLQVCEIIRTTTGADFPFMTDNETSKTGSYIGENTARSTGEGVSLSQTILKTYGGTTNIILVPNALFRDWGAGNLTAYLSDKLGERLGRFLNTESTTGAVKARGMMTRATLGKTCASSTAIQPDEIIDLIFSVDKAYRDQPGFGIMANDATVAHVRKFKDGTGAYIWSDGFQQGQPDRLCGAPLFVNNDMATIAASAKVIAAGLFSKQKIRLVQDIRLRMSEERYFEYDQTALVAEVDFDSDMVDAGTHPIKYMAMA